MANKKDDSKQPVVRRITAKDDSKPASKRSSTAKKAVVVNGGKKKPRKNPLGKFLGYFKGAWYELKQVRWPNRRATWSMTGALLMFTAIFVAFILLIDLAFESLFKLIIG